MCKACRCPAARRSDQRGDAASVAMARSASGVNPVAAPAGTDLPMLEQHRQPAKARRRSQLGRDPDGIAHWRGGGRQRRIIGILPSRRIGVPLVPSFPMTARTGGELIVASLLAQGATHAFGVPGESYLPVLDALHDVSERLRFIVCRNEGGAAFMAEAHGKLTGTPGVVLVTRGPGASNASIGIHTAMQDSTPMLVLIGQVGSDSSIARLPGG